MEHMYNVTTYDSINICNLNTNLPYIHSHLEFITKKMKLIFKFTATRVN